jgi:hypothetical protein
MSEEKRPFKWAVRVEDPQIVLSNVCNLMFQGKNEEALVKIVKYFESLDHREEMNRANEHAHNYYVNNEPWGGV